MYRVQTCPLCKGESAFFGTYQKRDYYQCFVCNGVFLSPEHFLSPDDEYREYLNHENDIHDSRYQQFVMPLVNLIASEQQTNCIGLDFGAGPGPVVAKLLQDKGYSISLYDPFFYPDAAPLTKKYDFIFCSEVIEHFNHPYKTFNELASLLKDDGTLYCKTSLLTDETNFSNWHYKNDATHVFFYHAKTVAWIEQNIISTGYKDKSIKVISHTPMNKKLKSPT